MVKRGEGLLLPALVELAILMSVFGLVFLFVSTSTDTSGYFQKFYLYDTQLIGELVSHSPGVTVVTYDNIKKNPLAFDFSGGVARVSIIEGEEKIARVRGFALYDGLRVESAQIQQPYFLSFIHSGDTMRVKEIASFVKKCQITTPAYNRSTMKLAIQSAGDTTQLTAGAHQTLSLAMREENPFDRENPNVIFRIETSEGEPSAVIRYPNTVDGSFIACVFEEQLKTVTGWSAVSAIPQTSNGPLALTLEVSQKELLDGTMPLPDRIIGEAIGRTMAIYLR